MTKEQLELIQDNIKELLDRNNKLKSYIQERSNKEDSDNASNMLVHGMLVAVNTIYRHILRNFF